MQTETRRAPTGGVVLASLLGAVLALVPVGLGTLMMALTELRGGTLERTFETMGPWGSLIVVALGASVLGSVAALIVTAWKPRVPGAVFAGLGLLPWAVGLVGTLAGLRSTLEAVAHVSPSDRAIISAVGTSEAVLSTLFGGLSSALLLLGSALGLGLLALLGARRPADSRVSGAPALLCAALALGVACQVLPWSPRREALEALANVNPADRLSILAFTVEELKGLRLLTGVGTWVALALGLAAGAWAARGLQGAGRTGRAVAVVLAVVPALGLYAQVQRQLSSLARAGSAQLWDKEADFTPIHHQASDEPRDVDAVVTLTHLVPREGAPVPLVEAEAAFRALLGPSRPEKADAAKPEDDKKRSLLKALAGRQFASPAQGDGDYLPGTPLELRLEPRLVLAPDARLTGAQLGALLDAARTAGARSVQFVGMQLSAEKLRYFDDEPLLAAYARVMAVHGTGPLALLSAVPRGAPEHDRFLWHARLEAPGPFTVRPRAGSSEEPRTLDPKAPPSNLGESGPRGASERPVYLALGGEGVTALDVVQSADQVEFVFPGQPIVLVTGELPGAPERALQPPSEEGFAGLGHALDTVRASAPPAVAGPLPKEVIQAVFHRHRAQVRFCYESGLNRRPGLAGKLVVRFTLSPSGAVKATEVGESTLGDADVERCVLARVRTWVFPSFQGDEAVVAYPFVFSPPTE